VRRVLLDLGRVRGHCLSESGLDNVNRCLTRIGAWILLSIPWSMVSAMGVRSRLPSIVPGFGANPVRSFRVLLGTPPLIEASFTLYEVRGGGHEWAWHCWFIPKDPERTEQLAQFAITRMEQRLGLRFTYPPDHWTHQEEVPDWL
jgi:hypothetical protein